MLNNKIIFMCAQPDVPYFHWQVEVMIVNFIKNGINPNWIEVLWAIDPGKDRSNELQKLINKYPYVRFFSYQKTINNNYGYIPILRPDIIEQHFKRFPNLRGEVIFYHDSDIIFRKLPNFDSLYNDMYWYLSDTISYIGADYIKSKSKKLFIDMCNIANIEPKLVEDNQLNSGGAQYLMKGLTSNYWKDVKETALSLYKYMSDLENSERKNLSNEDLKTYNPIQKWCADMWAVLWIALNNGVNIKISPELSFSWGTSSLSEYYLHNIMHNAGVTKDHTNLFFKGDFINKNPFIFDFSNIDTKTASYKYVESIKYVNKYSKINK